MANGNHDENRNDDSPASNDVTNMMSPAMQPTNDDTTTRLLDSISDSSPTPPTLSSSSTKNTSSSSSLSKDGYYYYLSAEARKQLPLYQYKGSDLSLLYKYILSPVATWSVQTFVPTTMAPNTITFIGLMGMLSAYVLYWWYVPNLGIIVVEEVPQYPQPPPSWIFVYNAIAMLVYQTLDNMDGKQARRVQSSSPLGLLFDHGCDAINSIFGSANWIIGMGLHVNITSLSSTDSTITIDHNHNNNNNLYFLYQCWILVFGPFAMFYVATWEQYYTGELIMPIINGPNEGLLGGVILSITSYVYGNQYWQQTTWHDSLIKCMTWTTTITTRLTSFWNQHLLLPEVSKWLIFQQTIMPLRNCDYVILISSIGFLQEIIWKSIIVTRRYPHQSPIRSLVPFIVLTICYALVGYYQPEVVLHNPRTVLHLAMLLFVDMSTELMLAHITAQVYQWYQRLWPLLPLILLTLWVMLVSSSTTTTNNDDWSSSFSSTMSPILSSFLLYNNHHYNMSYYLTAYTWSMATYLLMKCILIIHEICFVLQIWCFDIVTPFNTTSTNISNTNTSNTNTTSTPKTSSDSTTTTSTTTTTTTVPSRTKTSWFHPCNRRQTTRVRNTPLPTITTINNNHNKKTAAKTIYLIRHAESQENERNAALNRCFYNIVGNGTFPNYSDLRLAIQLLNISAQMDTPVSAVGTQQIKHMHTLLWRKEKTNFIDKIRCSHNNAPVLVVHSPLSRAFQTCYGILQCKAAIATTTVDDDDAEHEGNKTEQKVEGVSRVLQTELLLEKTLWEWTPLFHGNFLHRIEQFEDWLWEQDEQVVILVGHSQFFKTMLNLNFKFENCEIWEAQLDMSVLWDERKKQQQQEENVSSSSLSASMESFSGCILPIQWSKLKRKYECKVV